MYIYIYIHTIFMQGTCSLYRPSQAPGPGQLGGWKRLGQPLRAEVWRETMFLQPWCTPRWLNFSGFV